MVRRIRSVSQRLRLLLAVLAAGAAMAVAPGSANAEVTIGSNLAAAPTGSLLIAAGVTVSQHALPAGSTAPGGLVAPSDGVVVRWRIEVAEDVTPVALRITRPGNS